MPPGAISYSHTIFTEGHLFHNCHTLRPAQNGCHFADIFKYMLLNKFWLNFTKVCVLRLAINKSALVQVMAWHLTGDKPLPQPILTKISNVITRPNELILRKRLVADHPYFTRYKTKYKSFIHVYRITTCSIMIISLILIWFLNTNHSLYFFKTTTINTNALCVMQASRLLLCIT